ncbi:hypothetical protein ACODG4_03455 [Vagococcus fluvialis]|nr:hypothetical protein [Vagococcus fluvialis]
MDKIYIDSKGKNTVVEVPKFGEVVLVVKDGKVVRYEVKSINKLD